MGNGRKGKGNAKDKRGEDKTTTKPPAQPQTSESSTNNDSDCHDNTPGPESSTRDKGKRSENTVNTKSDKNDDENKKRLFVCCDGTRQNAADSTQYSTNVARFARCVDRLEPRGYETEKGEKEHIVQVVWYSSGVGTETTEEADRLFDPKKIDSAWSALTGAGMLNILFWGAILDEWV